MFKPIAALTVGHMRTEIVPKHTKTTRPLGNREMDRRIAELVKREKAKAK